MQVFSHIQLDGDFQKNVFAAPGKAKFPLVAAVNVAPTSPLLSGKVLSTVQSAKVMSGK